MVTIRPEKPQDYAGIHEINRLVFRRESEARVVEKIRVSSAFIPELALVAIGGKNVVGYALLSPVALEIPEKNIPALALMPLVVRPEYVKEDLGQKLLKHAFRECERMGFK
jgi:putative acetyltransferase